VRQGRFAHNSVWLARELERLAPLLPEAAGVSACEAPAFALAFVERYAGDVPQIEHAHEFLMAVLCEAGRREDDAVAVRVASGLAHVAGRLREPGTAERALRLGAEAAQRLGDWPRLAHLLHCLGCLEFSHGRAARGWRLWREGMELAETSGAVGDLWRSLSTFTQSSDILARYADAGRYLDPLARHGDDHAARAVALFIRAFHRALGDPDHAYDDLCDCLRLLATDIGGSASSALAPGQRQVFMMAAQTELARVRGDYAGASAYAQSAVELARVFADRYTVAALLFDAGMYAYRQGRHDDARARFRRMAEVAREMGGLPIHERGRHFSETRLGERTTGEPGLPPAPAVAGACLPESLSAREREVLRLVAAGLSNREIAVRLVVTEATVKKHLEHVYGKLDARSRTSALAAARALRLLD
jgi:DNA-binding NarL/FixJ family response regulator